MKCWGSNDWGQLGNAGGNSQYNPGDVCAPGSPRFVQPCTSILTGVATVGVPGLHTCAIMTDTGAYCWGYDNYDQTGDKYRINQPYGSQNDLDPQQVCAYVSSVPNCIVPLTSVVDITGGYAHTCALIDLANETLHGVMCWGQNNYGEVGDGTTCCDDSLQEYYRSRPQWVLN